MLIDEKKEIVILLVMLSSGKNRKWEDWQIFGSCLRDVKDVEDDGESDTHSNWYTRNSSQKPRKVF